LAAFNKAGLHWCWAKLCCFVASVQCLHHFNFSS